MENIFLTDLFIYSFKKKEKEKEENIVEKKKILRSHGWTSKALIRGSRGPRHSSPSPFSSPFLCVVRHMTMR